MTAFERRAAGLDRIIPPDVKIEHIACGFSFTEGPLWTGDGLLFSDIANSRIVRWRRLPEGPEVTTYRTPSNLANGLPFDRARRLIVCEGETRRLIRIEAGGTSTVLAERYQGKRINSPNDVVVAADESIYFSDPFWASRFIDQKWLRVGREEQELAFDGVFRVAPDGTLIAVAEDFERPNGLAFAPDGKTLYVNDTRRFHIRAFDVQPDGSLASSRVFAELRADEPGVPDGMKVDIEGNVYCTGPGGVWVVAPSGALLGRILLPEVPANVAWGDADWRSLYITARTGLYRIRPSIPGVPVP